MSNPMTSPRSTLSNKWRAKLPRATYNGGFGSSPHSSRNSSHSDRNDGSAASIGGNIVDFVIESDIIRHLIHGSLSLQLTCCYQPKALIHSMCDEEVQR